LIVARAVAAYAVTAFATTNVEMSTARRTIPLLLGGPACSIHHMMSSVSFSPVRDLLRTTPPVHGE
jgi:hypothetical protein